MGLLWVSITAWLTKHNALWWKTNWELELEVQRRNSCLGVKWAFLTLIMVRWSTEWSIDPPLLLQKMETTGVPLRILQDDMDYKRKWTEEYVWEFIPHYHTSTLNFKSLAFSPSAKSIKNHLTNRFYKTLEESDVGWVFKNLSGFLHVSPAMDQ